MTKISFLGRLLDLIAPRACTICGTRLAPGEDSLCAVCNMKLPRTHFDMHAKDNEMARMFWGLMPVERCSALFYFTPAAESSRLIYALKYGNRPDIGTDIGRITGTELAQSDFFEGMDAIVPIPLERSRQRQRGYNQSTEIARGVSMATGLPVIKNAIRRKTFTESQTKKNRWQRMENVNGTFELTNTEHVTGKHLLIIDDVVTTGATIRACGNELLKARGVTLSVLAMAFTKY